MRSGVIISAASHAVLVALVLLSTPKLFDATSIASIEVDLVRPDEIEPRPPEKPKEEKQAVWTPPLAAPNEPWPAAAPPARSTPAPAGQQKAAAPQFPTPQVTP